MKHEKKQAPRFAKWLAKAAAAYLFFFLTGLLMGLVPAGSLGLSGPAFFSLRMCWMLLGPVYVTLVARLILAFLPAACTRTNETPVYLSDLGGRAEISAAILALQVKRLISVDFALPLQGFDYAGYEDYPVRGSMALTAAGQEALDSLNIQGCGE